MDVMITCAALGAVAMILWLGGRGQPVDEEHCPYRVGTDRVGCTGPCERPLPCRPLG